MQGNGRRNSVGKCADSAESRAVANVAASADTTSVWRQADKQVRCIGYTVPGQVDAMVMHRGQNPTTRAFSLKWLLIGRRSLLILSACHARVIA